MSLEVDRHTFGGEKEEQTYATVLWNKMIAKGNNEQKKTPIEPYGFYWDREW